jgi:hypothetical protein
MVKLAAVVALDRPSIASTSRLALSYLNSAAQQELDPVLGVSGVGAMLDVWI